jgi:hypothetical protein
MMAKVQKTLMAGCAVFIVAMPVRGFAQNVPPHNPDGIVLVRGTVQNLTASAMTVRDKGDLETVKLAQPFHLYAREKSDLAQVKDNSFVGVTTVKQADGSERATEIHIFPEDLRGVGEGSHMMTDNPATASSRMTNGAVATPSRMSNGSVEHAGASTLIVQYAGGKQTVIVPPDVSVTELKPTTQTLADGDKVAVLAKKAADGSLSADKAILTGGK